MVKLPISFGGFFICQNGGDGTLGVWFFLVVNLGSVLLYMRAKRHLTPFEHFGMWIVSLLFLQNWLAILHNNLNQIITAKSNVLQVAISLNTIVLMPTVSTLFGDRILARTDVLQKIRMVFIYLVTVGSLEYLSQVLGLFRYVHWSIWQSVTLWLIQLVVLAITVKVLRRWLIKGEVI